MILLPAVELTGIEPVFRQCHCRVLPLDDSPVVPRSLRGGQARRGKAAFPWLGTRESNPYSLIQNQLSYR